VRKLLDVWPALPLVIDFDDEVWPHCYPEDGFDDVIPALEHCDRVRWIHIDRLTSSQFERIATVMHKPFLALKYLWFQSSDGALLLPNTFLNGSAPSLQTLSLFGVSFPTLPRLLLSASGLTSLRLNDIPNTGYFAPEVMAACLSALITLETLSIEFRCPTPHPKRRGRGPPPLTRNVLPALTKLQFRGVSEYLEVLTARIDAPLLHKVVITFFNQLVFDIPQISRFIGHLGLPRPSKLSLSFYPYRNTDISFSWPQEGSHGEGYLMWNVLCKGLDWQVFSIAQICARILPLCSSVEWLNIKYGNWGDKDPPLLGIQQDDMDPTRWLELFHSFTSVQNLEIPAELEPCIAAALQGLSGESAADILPMLHKLFIDRLTTDTVARQGMESFITARHHSDHPVTIDRW
jgi:hypothetical protein